MKCCKETHPSLLAMVARNRHKLRVVSTLSIYVLEIENDMERSTDAGTEIQTIA